MSVYARTQAWPVSCVLRDLDRTVTAARLYVAAVSLSPSNDYIRVILGITKEAFYV